MTMRRILVAALIFLAVGLICPLAYAEESSAHSDWEFSLAPMYLWAVSIDGDMTVKGNDVEMDVPFNEIFDNLKGALTFHLRESTSSAGDFSRI